MIEVPLGVATDATSGDSCAARMTEARVVGMRSKPDIDECLIYGLIDRP